MFAVRLVTLIAMSVSADTNHGGVCDVTEESAQEPEMAIQIPRYVESIRPHYFGEHHEMLRIVLNAVSPVEADLALGLVEPHLPPRALVTALNLREALAELPRCPIPMPIDFETLSGIWRLGRLGDAWHRGLADPGGDYDLLLLGNGNLCLDIVVRNEGKSRYWMPADPENDFVNPAVLDLLISRETLVGQMVDLVKAMGLPFQPSFYFSLHDWHMEYADRIFGEIEDTFAIEQEERRYLLL